MSILRIDYVKGVEGNSIYVDDNRIVGKKPWGGGVTLKTWEVDKDTFLTNIRNSLGKGKCHTCKIQANIIKDLQNQIGELQSNLKGASINAEAMAEIKATIDGGSDQPVKDIVYGAIEELKELRDGNG